MSEIVLRGNFKITVEGGDCTVGSCPAGAGSCPAGAGSCPAKADGACAKAAPAAPLKVYYNAASGNALPIVALLQETGLPHELVDVDLMKGAQYQPEFTAMNPCHHVPVLKDGDHCVFESGAILRYIANRYLCDDHWYPKCPVARSRIDSALDWRQTELLTAFRPLFLTLMGLGAPDWGNVPNSRKNTTAALKVLEEHWLGARHFIGGDHISIADLSVAPFLKMLEVVTDFELSDALKAYRERLHARLPRLAEAFAAPGKFGMDAWIGMKKVSPLPTPFGLVDAANREFERRFNGKDAEGVGALYCEAGSMSPPGQGGKVFNGRGEIAGFWKGAMDAGLTNLELKTGHVAAFGDHFVETSAYSHSGGNGNYCVIWQHEENAWKILKDIFN